MTSFFTSSFQPLDKMQGLRWCQFCHHSPDPACRCRHLDARPVALGLVGVVKCVGHICDPLRGHVIEECSNVDLSRYRHPACEKLHRRHWRQHLILTRSIAHRIQAALPHQRVNAVGDARAKASRSALLNGLSDDFELVELLASKLASDGIEVLVARGSDTEEHSAGGLRLRGHLSRRSGEHDGSTTVSIGVDLHHHHLCGVITDAELFLAHSVISPCRSGAAPSGSSVRSMATGGMR
jgi:hypothetical protein